jgi:geranylgeranyl reductase family protein
MLGADVVVVGCGPAGTAAAITAARAGLRVVAVDRARFPRDKCCGDGLTTGALRRLEDLGLHPASLASWQPVTAAHVRAPDGRSARFHLPDGSTYAATVRRCDLDAALVDVARAHGVTVREATAVTGVRPARAGDAVDVDLDDGEVIRAWYAVAADGMWSPVRRHLGVGDPGYLGEWHAVRQYLRGGGPATRDLWVWFEEDLRPGYVWSFPLPDGGVNVGFGIQRVRGESTGTMKRQWEDILRRPHIAEVLGPDAVAEGPIKAWPIPARVGQTRVAALDGRVLFVGDAARASDRMTGEGIAQALETGALAAGTLAAWGPDAPGAAAAAYRAALARGMAIDAAVSGVFSRVLRSDWGASAWFDVATAGPRASRHFARWMFEDYPRAAPITPWRWQRGLLGRPGAYATASRPVPAADRVASPSVASPSVASSSVASPSVASAAG